MLDDDAKETTKNDLTTSTSMATSMATKTTTKTTTTMNATRAPLAPSTHRRAGGDQKHAGGRLGYAPLFGRVVFSGGRLPAGHPFGLAATVKDRLAMPRVRMRAFRTVEYHRLCTGGFSRVCTERCRVYWLAQNARAHLTPDWKLHFSVAREDIALAWDILCALFLDHACDFGIKVTTAEALGNGTWPEKQRGREITLYMFTHDPSYDVPSEADAGPLPRRNNNNNNNSHRHKNSNHDAIPQSLGGPMAALAEKNEVHKFWLSKEYERPGAFWRSLVREAERRLRAYKIRSAGCADGDLPLGQYASLRNEAFVAWEGKDGVREMGPSGERDGKWKAIYPPNAAGWNAANQPVPPIISDSWPEVVHRHQSSAAATGTTCAFTCTQQHNAAASACSSSRSRQQKMANWRWEPA
uniref:Uncharacterized protein n=1 Tax=Lotharella globosa TaxID=91324 RepID=A0A7S4DTC0_9EUKA|mmetsp:Transcript_19143/g.38701  ORF Transcript_19143/g.38701 Transcript_19143/m.38701 type:complete len:411 (-) Transcript_19143:356-1588(-)|eukprot:CAMPEP_0167821346 /NCGR_PEP_ID=MMETSP0112_2-20121227/6730_1 /TAXON_ID=91324 /ORGANISM="Lotharella globosa, Strain CCCM811" /LENGTH=410 /DNA_ID=CAMNT_0007722273 /DNA_START=78 /DNA_END=1310 /DNA_ORIENTATION=-